MSLPDHCSIQEFIFWLNFFRNPSSGIKIFRQKRDSAGFLSYFLKLQKLFRSPAMSLASTLAERYVKFFQTTSSIRPLQNLLGWRPHTSLVVACVHCRVQTEHYSRIGGGLAVPPPPVWSRYFTWPLPTLHDTVHSHGLRNLEIIVFNLLEWRLRSTTGSFL